MTVTRPHLYEKVLRGALIKVAFKLKRRGGGVQLSAKMACEVNSIFVLDMPAE
jgi:hypothetical protein